MLNYLSTEKRPSRKESDDLFTVWSHWSTRQRLILLLTLISLVILTSNVLFGPHYTVFSSMVLSIPIILCIFYFGLQTGGWVALVGIAIIIPQWFHSSVPGLPYAFHVLSMLALAFFFYNALDKESRLHQRHVRAMRILLQQPAAPVKTIDYSKEAALVLDEKSNILEVSPQAIKLLVLAESELHGRKIQEIFPALPEEHNSLGDCKGEFSWSKTNGSAHTFEYILRPLYDRAGPSGKLLILFDITEERRKAEAYLQAAKFSVIGQVSSGLAHEIRNPLTTIKGFIQLMGPDQWPEKWRPYHQLILDEINATDHLLEEFLLLTNPSAPLFQPIYLHQVIHSTAEMLKAHCAIHEVKIVSKLPILEPILGDADQLRQALLSIFQNAIEASTPGSEVFLTLSKKDEHLEVWVEDQGPGIPPEIIDQVFDPFFTTHKEGTGLGLTIARQITLAHNGQLILTQAKPGKGTKVILSFPVFSAVTEELSA